MFTRHLKQPKLIAYILLLVCGLSLLIIGLSHRHKTSVTSSSFHQHPDYPLYTAVVPESFPPFFYTSEEREPYGMAIEVLDELDHLAGFRSQFIVKKSWSEVFDSIDNGEADLIPSLGITEARKNKYLFTRPYATTSIHVFSRNDTSLTRADLLQLKVAVIADNAGKKAAEAAEIQNAITFESIDLAFYALIEGKVDAVIYPRAIAYRSAREMKIQHLIKDTGINLMTIHRAIAVSKQQPALFKQISKALDQYMKSQDYIDTYSSWLRVEPDTINTRQLIVTDIAIIIICVLSFIFYWQKKNPILTDQNGHLKKEVAWIIKLITFLIISTLTITGLTLYILYDTSFKEQRSRLIDTARSRASLIEAIARYDQKEYPNHLPSNGLSAYERTLSQVTAAQKHSQGLGATGEFTLARLDHDRLNMDFIAQQRHASFTTPVRIPVNSDLAAPMRLALFGHSGTMIGLDYRGENVLAAYEPIKVLNLGIVAKIDLAEIRKPFIDSALIVLGIVSIVSCAGAMFLFSVLVPVIQRITSTEKRFQQLFRNTLTPTFLVDPKTSRIIDANQAAIQFYGYNQAEFTRLKLTSLYPPSSDEAVAHLKQATSKNQTFTTVHLLQNGTLKNVEALTNAVELDDETVISFIVTDATGRIEQEKANQKIQKELEQSRKMEALGQLTGGIAHDFNNMLGVIIGYSSLTQDKIKSQQTDKVSEYLNHVLTAAARAKELIQSMMIFSRTGENKNKPYRIGSLVKENIKMMRSIIPSSIDIQSDINNDLPSTIIEPVKLQQLIMNLCINARDAMSGEGKLSVKLDWYRSRNQQCRLCYEHINGDWIELSVSDTGTGMTAETLAHIFEPFYTTKEQGKGTGMGMSVVHGIVTELDGHAMIDSEPGKGTRVSILLKPVSEEENQESSSPAVTTVTESDKHILIVDDEITIVDLLKSMLEEHGYQCKSFSSAVFALDYFNDHPDEFDLIISDQTMPELTGFFLIKEMRKTRPELAAIISTGYSEYFNENIARLNDISFLAKPVTKETLLKAVQEALVKHLP